MIERPDMILVGAATRNVGKTEFCCRLIRNAAAAEEVIAVKITPVKEMESGFQITEECRATPDTDTGRMLAAGAKQAFWLRTSREGLEQGLVELLRRIPEHIGVVCESTRARAVVQPGGFIIIQAENSEEMKPSCRRLMELADRIVTFHGDGWDTDPSSISFQNNRWETI